MNVFAGLIRGVGLTAVTIQGFTKSFGNTAEESLDMHRAHLIIFHKGTVDALSPRRGKRNRRHNQKERGPPCEGPVVFLIHLSAPLVRGEVCSTPGTIPKQSSRSWLKQRQPLSSLPLTVLVASCCYLSTQGRRDLP